MEIDEKKTEVKKKKSKVHDFVDVGVDEFVQSAKITVGNARRERKMLFPYYKYRRKIGR